MAKSKRGKSNKSNRGKRSSPRKPSSSRPLMPVNYQNPDPVMQVTEPEVVNSIVSPLVLIILIVLFAIAITCNYLALMWLLKLDEIDCKCSDSWMRYYIKYFLYAYFVMLAINIVLDIYFLISGEKFRDSSIRIPFTYIKLIFSLFGIANAIIAIVYIDQLKKMNCECSDDIKREVYWYYNIIKVSFYAFIILLAFASVILMR